jgi:hypothetical protein
MGKRVCPFQAFIAAAAGALFSEELDIRQGEENHN